MTALCGGGTSSAKVGFARFVDISSASAEALFVLLGLEGGAFAAPFVAGMRFDLLDYCANDPPAVPDIQPIDWFNLLDPIWTINQADAAAKFQQLVGATYWYQLCKCDTAATPAAPTPTLPAPPQSSPNLPSGQAAAKCWDVTATFDYGNAGNLGVNVNGNVLLWPDGGTHIPGDTFRQLPNPPPTLVTVSARPNAQGANSPTQGAVQVTFHDATGHAIGSLINGTLQPDGHTSKVSAAPPVGATAVDLNLFYNSGTQPQPAQPPTGTITLTAQLECSGQGPANPIAPCCPPDPATERTLRMILANVQAILESLPAEPNSYAEGTFHTGLQGNGSFLLNTAALAVKVILTQRGPGQGEAAGEPPRLFEVGRITAITAEAPVAGVWIEYASQLFPLPPLTEQIGYSLKPGVTATIVEITAGP